jgi:hypothetical protein
VNGFDVLPVGSEWILLLQWDALRNRFNPLADQHGVVAIDGNVVRPLGILRNQWDARPLEEFEAALRAATEAPPKATPPS